jgi:hypothetical protein
MAHACSGLIFGHVSFSNEPAMRRHIPSTRALLIFDAVARHHGVGKAAEELCLTHSAVS